MSSTETFTDTVARSGHARSGAAEAPAVIEARDLSKSFRVPTHRIDSLKERAVHPFTRLAYRELQALKEVSFEVRRGEFFGIVGRNGSGKSTLLKLLASIYRADGGTIRMAGRVAPFIELGVGFNADLTARENVELNGVMMGLTRRESRRRLDAVLDFAELADFVDLKLKNYSSGMLVRLAFSLMIQSRADILLIDEVLAVGDAAFQQKCADVFREMRDGDRTVVLVTHDMASVDRYCHRAMLLEEGEQLFMGDPEQAGREYLRINFREHRIASAGNGDAGVPDLQARILRAQLEDAEGGPIENVAEGEPIRIDLTLEARVDMSNPHFNLTVVDDDGDLILEYEPKLGRTADGSTTLRTGERVRLRGALENPLTPGRYTVHCWVSRSSDIADLALQTLDVFDFVVYGTGGKLAKVRAEGEISAIREGTDEH
jgi:ABC-type polysaccharide/polyol phosphate transport system ATPase subunit